MVISSFWGWNGRAYAGSKALLHRTDLKAWTPRISLSSWEVGSFSFWSVFSLIQLFTMTLWCPQSSHLMTCRRIGRLYCSPCSLGMWRCCSHWPFCILQGGLSGTGSLAPAQIGVACSSPWTYRTILGSHRRLLGEKCSWLFWQYWGIFHICWHPRSSLPREVILWKGRPMCYRWPQHRLAWPAHIRGG